MASDGPIPAEDDPTWDAGAFRMALRHLTAENEQPMKMEQPSERVLALFRSVAPGGPEAQERKMFGQPCAFLHGNMFMGLFGDSFMVRLGPKERAEALASGGEPFAPMGRTMREYVTLPHAVMDDPEAMRSWVDRAYAYADTLPPKVPKPRARPATRRQG